MGLVSYSIGGRWTGALHKEHAGITRKAKRQTCSFTETRGGLDANKRKASFDTQKTLRGYLSLPERHTDNEERLPSQIKTIGIR